AHVEICLIRLVAMGGADRTGAPGAATRVDAIGAARAVDVTDARRNVITFGRKRVHRTGGQAGLVITTIARSRAGIGWRQFDPLTKGQRSAPGMPQAPVGMNEHADGRWIDGLG